jgi:hypothetical protein
MKWRLTGSRVDLWLDGSACLATSNANSLTLPSLPAAIQPSAARIGTAMVSDNGLTNPGCFTITTGAPSVVNIGLNFVTGSLVACGLTAFTTSGSKGLPTGWMISYDLGN